MNNWVLVADSCHARIFEIDSTNFSLAEVADFIYPIEGHHGRNPVGHISAARTGTHHGLEPKTLPKEKARHEFASRLMNHLLVEYSNGRFSKLILVAAPEFLGELRSAAPHGLRSTIVLSIKKDLLKYSNAELSDFLRVQLGRH